MVQCGVMRVSSARRWRWVITVAGLCAMLHLAYRISDLPQSSMLLPHTGVHITGTGDGDQAARDIEMTDMRRPRTLMDGTYHMAKYGGETDLWARPRQALPPGRTSRRTAGVTGDIQALTSPKPPKTHISPPLPVSNSNLSPNVIPRKTFSEKAQGDSSDTVSVCPGLSKPAEEVVREDRQRFEEVSAGRSYVFSAWFDGRLPRRRVVRIVGTADVRVDGKPVYCRMWYSHRKHPHIVTVNDEIVPETHNKRFAAFIYVCPVKGKKIPYAVSLSREKCEVASNLLPVQHPHPAGSNSTLKLTFTVCVTPINMNYNNVHQLVEFIEVNRIFGADKFVFYNYSIGVDVNKYLHQYENEGIAEVIQWKLPVRVDTWPPSLTPDIHYFGQLGALNDCVYRHLYRTKFLVFLDLDEILVPKVVPTWNMYISDVMSSRPSGTAACAYVFPNVFFRTEWSHDPLSLNDSFIREYHLQTLLYTKRENEIWKHGFRSKYIADPRKIEMGGVHLPWKCVGGRYDYYVPDNEALLHHYRSWDDPKQMNAVQDTTLYNYRSVIVDHVRHRYRTMENIEKPKTRL